MRFTRWLAVSVILAFASFSLASAPVTPVQVLYTGGDPVGDVATAADAALGVGPLNDSGQLCFSTDSDTAGRLLVQSDSGRLGTIVAPGESGPAGAWPDNLWFDVPVGMNAGGSVVFSGLLVPAGGNGSGGTFLWEFPDRTVTPIALPGMPTSGRDALGWAAGPAPAINKRSEIALVSHVNSPAGRTYYGVFFRSNEKQLEPVAVPDQALPSGGKVLSAYQPSLRDDGSMALLIKRQGDALEYPYLWEQGRLSPLNVTGVRQKGKLLIGFDGVWVNNRNRAALMAAQLHSLNGHYVSLFLTEGDRTKPVALPGQEMPGGGKFRSVQDHGVSLPDDQGRHAFLADLEGGVTGAYLMQPDGSLSLLLKSGTLTSAGPVTDVGHGADGGSWGIGLNSRGQAAFTVGIAEKPDALVALPAAVPGAAP